MRPRMIVGSLAAFGAVTLGAVPLVGALTNEAVPHAERPAAAPSTNNPLAFQAGQIRLYRYFGAVALANALEAARSARRGGGGGGGRCVEHPVSYGTDDGQYSIPAEIVARESNGNYGSCNEGSGACGAYQVLPSTWDGYGGYGSACDAPPEVQDQWAAEAYAQSGTAAWGG